MNSLTIRVLALAAVLLSLPVSAPAVEHPRVADRDPCATAQCHPGLARAPAGVVSVHEPVGSGECLACHDLALAGSPSRLRDAGRGGRDAAGRSPASWDLAFCGRCHEEKLLAGEGAAAGTDFMEKRRNLHYVHVAAGGKGRGCLTCHDAHQAPQPHLLRAEIPARGGARIPQQFREQARGGWCRTGCHAPKSYARE